MPFRKHLQNVPFKITLMLYVCTWPTWNVFYVGRGVQENHKRKLVSLFKQLRAKDTVEN